MGFGRGAVAGMNNGVMLIDGTWIWQDEDGGRGGRETELMEEVSRELDLLDLGLVETGRSGIKRPVISGPFKIHFALLTILGVICIYI